MIEQSEWKWFGNAGHLRVGESCRFHLCTLVGEHLVSTVGEYWTDESVREIFAKSRGVTLEGRGSERQYDYMRKVGYEEIGSGRKYETMVFKAGPVCECGCGMPQISGSELDFSPANDGISATANHMELCRRWATTDAVEGGE